MAHEMWELKQRQSLPLKAKIQMTITRVREWYEYWFNKGEDVYLSWSGGKDRLNMLIEQDKNDEASDYIKELFYGKIATETEINDILWFDDYINDLISWS